MWIIAVLILILILIGLFSFMFWDMKVGERRRKERRRKKLLSSILCPDCHGTGRKPAKGWEFTEKANSGFEEMVKAEEREREGYKLEAIWKEK